MSLRFELFLQWTKSNIYRFKNNKSIIIIIINQIDNIILVRWSNQVILLLKALVKRKIKPFFKKKKDKQGSEVRMEPTALNACQHLCWCVQPLISTSSCRRCSPPPVSWHFLIFLATRVWRLRACVSRRSLHNPPNKQEISPWSPANMDPLLWLPLVSANYEPLLVDVISDAQTLHSLSNLWGLIWIDFLFFFANIESRSQLTHTLPLPLTLQHSSLFLPPPLCFFLFSPLIHYPPSLFLPFSHTFPASACSPFLLLSPALIEIQLCNSLSEDAIDLSPSCAFWGILGGRREKEKDGEETGGERDDRVGGRGGERKGRTGRGEWGREKLKRERKV